MHRKLTPIVLAAAGLAGCAGLLGPSPEEIAAVQAQAEAVAKQEAEGGEARAID